MKLVLLSILSYLPLTYSAALRRSNSAAAEQCLLPTSVQDIGRKAKTGGDVKRDSKYDLYSGSITLIDAKDDADSNQIKITFASERLSQKTVVGIDFEFYHDGKDVTGIALIQIAVEDFVLLYKPGLVNFQL